MPLTKVDVAVRLNMSTSTVDRLAKRGEIESTKDEFGRVCYTVAAVKAYQRKAWEHYWDEVARIAAAAPPPTGPAAARLAKLLCGEPPRSRGASMPRPPMIFPLDGGRRS